MTTVLSVLQRHQHRIPEAAFYTCLHGSRGVEVLTYGELGRAGRRLRAFCAARAISRGSMVLVILPHSGDLIRALVGCIEAGMVPSLLAVPSFKLDLEVYRREIRSLVTRIDAALLLTTREIAGSLSPALEGSRCPAVTWSEVETCEAADPGPPEPKPDDILLLQHSSGSTGLKKGVALSNRAVLTQISDYARAIDLRPSDRIVSWLPLYHDMGLIAATLLPLVTANPVVALSPFAWVANPVSLLQTVTEHRPTLCWLPNFAYNFLARRVRDRQLRDLDLGSIRAWINCSEPVIAASHRLFLQRFAGVGVRMETLHTCYALAENTFATTQSGPGLPEVERVDRQALLERGLAMPVADERAAALELMSSGRRLAHCEVRILDSDKRPLPERHVGEIALRSPYLFTGYFRLASETADAFHEGWHLTGDLGYQAGEELFVTGRKKDLIIIGGRNYYPQDVERIVGDDPDVIDGRVVALGRSLPEEGTEGLIVLAESHLTEPVAREDACLRIRQALVFGLDCSPTEIRLVPHMWLLKTSSGKIARAPNLQRYLEKKDTP